MTEKQLTALYKRYNKKYFDNELPAEVPVRLVDMGNTNSCGLTTLFAEPGLSLHTIYLDSNLVEHDVFLKFTLLHEMVHVKQRPSDNENAHGQKFDEEMLRLAFRGAFRGIW